MRLSIAVSAFCAIPGLALTLAPQNNDQGVAKLDAHDRAQTHSHAHTDSRAGTLYSPGSHLRLDDKHIHPGYHRGHKHPAHAHHLEDKVLTDILVTNKLNQLADRADDIATYVKAFRHCSFNDHCWKNVRNALYELEFELDAFDTTIDKSNLDKCFTCTQESKIACAYKTYADSLIRMLVLVRDKTQHLPGEIDKYVLTAINSMRGADSTFVHELGRRMYCEDSLKVIMAKHGAVDGTTKGSINEAFSKFIFTPLITGEHFKGHGHRMAH